MAAKKTNIEDCIQRAKTLVSYNCPYVWSGNGEEYSSFLVSDLVRMETSVDNMSRVLRYIKNHIINKKARIFDCSGFIFYLFLKYKLLSGDITANGLFKKWKTVSFLNLRAGDLLYKCETSLDKKGKPEKNAYHVGLYIGDNLVIHCKGRDYGLVCESTSFERWTDANRPDWE